MPSDLDMRDRYRISEVPSSWSYSMTCSVDINEGFGID